MSTVLLALGANVPGRWGAPEESLFRARDALARYGMRILASSHIYETAPWGPGRQAPYLNAVIRLQAHAGPVALLQLTKRIEREAGRRKSARWGPRPLDIDIIDFAGQQLGWSHRRRKRGRLILPHPEMHKRPFVLVPLLEIEPHWEHPVLKIPGRALLARLGVRVRRQGVLRSLDFAPSACEKG